MIGCFSCQVFCAFVFCKFIERIGGFCKFRNSGVVNNSDQDNDQFNIKLEILKTLGYVYEIILPQIGVFFLFFVFKFYRVVCI